MAWWALDGFDPSDEDLVCLESYVTSQATLEELIAETLSGSSQ
jgi:hypothetical protein